MSPEELTDPAVRTVVTALCEGDRDAFYGAFAPGALLTDDGAEQDLHVWSEREIFNAHGRVEVREEREDGHYLLARFRSDQWNFPDTFWHFRIDGGKVTRMDVGQA
ncbi:nuclear transport factor 2 family protein [Streptomyces sp. NPDC049577]|uniref:nuclear transport factor 2 family protein n=1 Tax=Streptomyces sp. NPDC049577 TaxID=3155153 RepID=UPI003448DC3D